MAEKPNYEIQAYSAREAFLKAVDDVALFNKEYMFAVQIMRGNHKTFTDVNQDSVKNAIVNIALTGITLNPALGLAYLVPRSVKGKGMCACLDFSYRGLIKVAADSGVIKHIRAVLVYDYEEFEYSELNGEQSVYHKVNIDPPEGSTVPAVFWDHIRCAYTVSVLADGTKLVSEPMLKWKLKKAMETSKTTADGTPWRTHPDEMCVKTILKHSIKTLPHSDKLSTAVHVINEFEGVEVSAPARIGGGNRAAEALAASRRQAQDAEFTDQAENPEEKGPDICPGEGCGKLRVEGICHNMKCEHGQMP